MAESKYPDLTTFKALSFDCYGTIIDWEPGLLKSLSYVTTQLPKDHPMNQDPPVKALKRFDELSMALEEARPTLPYNENFVESLGSLAGELGIAVPDSVAEPFGNSPGTWPPFPDSVEALARLKRRYKLIILSNVNNSNMQATLSNQLPTIPFDAAYTAQDIGSYKPNEKNFTYLFQHAKDELGIDKEQGDLLHVACSLKVDHVAAKKLGLRSCWISRGGDGGGVGGQGSAENKGYGGSGGDLNGGVDEYEGRVAYEWRFDTLGLFADEVERQFSAKGL